MGKLYDAIDDEIQAWIAAQRVFFVATAPRDGALINCSPKGLDTLAVLGPRELAYVDLGGSGIETVAHLKENGRIVIMMCAFEDPPRILRFHGRGRVIEPQQDEFAALLRSFPTPAMCRAIIRIELTRIQDSCGYGVPLMGFKQHRDTLPRYVRAKSRDEIQAALARHNRRSIEGLPGLSGASEAFLE